MTEPRRKLDEYGSQEMAIPEWRIIQKTGGDYAKTQGGEPGQFYNSIIDEIADELNIIVVDILSGRARWGQEITSAGPICASFDARSNISLSGEDCTKCQYRVDTPWSMSAAERRTMCCLNYAILGIDLDYDHIPVILRMHGISALPTRQLMTQLRMNRSLKGQYHRAKINIKGVAKDTPYGTAYVMRPKIVKLITEEVEVEELRVESLRLLGTPIPLPEGRPEEEPGPEGEGEPLGFTAEGTPFFTEEEGQRLLAEEEQPKGWSSPIGEETKIEDSPVVAEEVKEKVKEVREVATPPAAEAEKAAEQLTEKDFEV